MRNKICYAIFSILFLLPNLVAAQTTEFTYQGRLTDNNGIALTGSYDFQFGLFDANGNLLGTQTRLGVSVSNGSFTTTLDYGTNPQRFDGAARLLQISVRPAGNGSYTDLLPRQPITSAPYSIRSREAATADAATNATQLGGVPAAQFVQSDAGGNVSVGGNLTVGGTLTQAVVNATTEYQIGGQRVLRATGSNLFVGFFAGQSNPTGGNNSFFGNNAGFDNTTGFNNSFFGSNAGRSNTASYNSFFGQSAGSSNTTGEYNSFFGLNAGRSNTEGDLNSFFGRQAGQDNTTGSRNSFFGEAAGFNNTTGRDNAFFGSSSGLNNTTGIFNSFFGRGAGLNNLDGGSNAFVGGNAGLSNTSGDNNSFFGTAAGSGNTTGNNNVMLGSSAGSPSTTGSNNIFIGRFAGQGNLTGSNNTLVGGGANVSANNLTYAAAFGSGAVVNSSNTVVLGRNLDTVQIPGNLNLTGSFTGNFTVPATNITGILGTANGGTNLSSPGGNGNFLRSNGTSWTSSPFDAADIPDLSITNDKLDNAAVTADKIADGEVVKSMNNLTDNVTLAAGANISITPSGNTLTIAATGGGGCGEPCTANIFNAATQYNLGGQTFLRTQGGDNTFGGFGAGLANPSDATGNTAFGFNAGRQNANGIDNSFFGTNSGSSQISGTRNSYFGSRAGRSISSGFDNSFFGASAGLSGVGITGNSFFGSSAGQEQQSGINNSYFGYLAGDRNQSGSNNTAIGANTQIGISPSSISNATAIGAGSRVLTSNTIALGRANGADTVRIYGNLVVDGTTSFTAKANEVLEASVKKQHVQIQNQQDQIQKQNAQIEVQAKQLQQQQLVIDALKKIVCQTNPTAGICSQGDEK